ncbi:MAG: DUF3048 domain-containing protein [Sarcina sp.]
MKKKFLILTVSLMLGFSVLTSFILFSIKPINKTDIPVTAPPLDDALEYVNNETDIFDINSINPYTGKILSGEELNNKAFACIIENSNQSRPQSGLSKADFVYETMAEGGISRFIALFSSNYVDKIGPIRSARSYFLDILSEFNLPFAHCGGSSDSLEEISNDTSFKSIDEMSNGKYFSRDTARNAPHNLYTSTEDILSAIDSKNFSEIKYPKELNFSDAYWENDSLLVCNNLNLQLSHSYSTSYTFNENGYIKSMDGVESIDEYNDELLTFDNIVIQITNITTREDNYRLDIDLIGSGIAYVISNGKFIKGTWNKPTSMSSTLIRNDNGNIIPFSTGNTIWHIIDSSNELSFY